MAKSFDLTVVGGGLAGSEAAWQAAEEGLRVALYEMRPTQSTGAHISDSLAELVCSNSLGSNLVDRASGLLKEELRLLSSLLVGIADDVSVPAGRALAVDRQWFAAEVTNRVSSHPKITLIREEVSEIPSGLTVIASGPLTSSKMAAAISRMTGENHLFFFDAISPIVSADSINMDITYRASRYADESGEGADYLNCPFTKPEFEAFAREIVSAERIELHDFEEQIHSGVRAGTDKYFEGCLPIEVIAERGAKALAFGPMRPIGLHDSRNGKRAAAIVQLRQDNLAGSLYNLVGFQTNLKFEEQKRVFRMIPGLENALFERYGQMHRNTFINSPELIWSTLQYRGRSDLFFAGQITGVEGYVGNIATGLLAGVNAARLFNGQQPLSLPITTMVGALCSYIVNAAPDDFQPMKANFGIVPKIDGMDRAGRRNRARAYADRSLHDLEEFLHRSKQN